MKILVTGGTSGLGKHIAESGREALSLSRANGYNIINAEDRKRIAEESLNVDVFINNAFDGPPHEEWADLGQVRLLGDVYALWEKEQKSGYIINIGSIASLFPIREYHPFHFFRVAKLALDEASFACTKAFLNDIVPFRTSLIRFGRLNTELARSRDNWTGNGHDLSHISESIFHLVSSPKNTCVYSLDLDVNLKFSENGLP